MGRITVAETEAATETRARVGHYRAGNRINEPAIFKAAVKAIFEAKISIFFSPQKIY